MKRYIYVILTAGSMIIAGCSRQGSIEKTSEQFNALPRPVRQAVRSRAPDAEIASVDRKTQENMIYYEIEFKNPDRHPKISVAENGTIISRDAEKSMGSPGPLSGRETGTGSKPAEPANTLGAPKGTTGKAASIDLSALPMPVQKTLKAQVPDGLITGITRHDDHGRTVYEFEFEEQGKNPTMWIAEDGTVVQSLKK